MSRSCARCGDAAAVRGSVYCTACAVSADRPARAEKPDRYRALTRARQIDLHDVREADRRWVTWAGQAGIDAEPDHLLCGARCVASLDGGHYHAGVVVAIERCANGSGRKPPIRAFWVWLLGGSPARWELHQPFLKFARERVEIVRRGKTE